MHNHTSRYVLIRSSPTAGNPEMFSQPHLRRPRIIFPNYYDKYGNCPAYLSLQAGRNSAYHPASGHSVIFTLQNYRKIQYDFFLMEKRSFVRKLAYFIRNNTNEWVGKCQVQLLREQDRRPATESPFEGTWTQTIRNNEGFHGENSMKFTNSISVFDNSFPKK